ncbi:MAG: SOS response-associated peptidase [Flavobacteriales bacterium]
MCGRYTLAGKPIDLEKHFRAKLKEDIIFDMANIAPTMIVPVIYDDNKNEILPAKWGMRPPWDRNPESKFKPLINLRDDSLMQKPFMRRMLKKRCIILASGFYEWTGEKGHKQAHLITLTNDLFIGFAGLWQEEVRLNGEQIRSCAIITTIPNKVVEKIHNRMPVIVPPHLYDDWLNGMSETMFFRPYNPENMKVVEAEL